MIKIVRLKDGSMAVGQDNDTDYIENAMGIQMQPSQNGLGMSLYPLLFPFSEDTHDIPKDMVMVDIKEIELGTQFSDFIQKYKEASSVITIQAK
jgi:hypothetical protein